VNSETIKRGPGRPRKAHQERQRYRISIGFTDVQWLVLQRRATDLGLTLHEYMRATVLQSISA